ncbi:MAG: hypothetical protein ACOY3P_07545 [Planctomycetota bacterium]
MNITKSAIVLVAAAALVAMSVARAAEQKPAPDLWELARAKAPVHRFSTLVMAGDVRDLLTPAGGIDAAIDWCRKTGVTKVYLETFRGNYQAERPTLLEAKRRFTEAGFEVSGCVTTTVVGKKSTGWNQISCYTDLPTQKRLQEIFEFTAGLFDEIMIDDFWFTDCECSECRAARQAKTVRIGEDRSFLVASDSWADYRCELMTRLSQLRILEPAQAINPRVKIIIKYPQWYDRFHERGYDVVRQTELFDRTWVGTETRDYLDQRWGGTPQYEAYFIMRWLGGIGGEKCGGGWYDPLGTTEKTYIEQARQTVLGGARESMLFCYGILLKNHGPRDVEALREHIPELLNVAAEIAERKPVGIAAYKPPSSPPQNEPRVFDFVGMLGLPLVPCHEFPADARAAFFSVHAMKDPQFTERLKSFLKGGRRALITDGLAKQLAGTVDLKRENVRVLDVKGDPKSLLELDQPALASLRKPLLAPYERSFEAPPRVALYLFDDGSWVIENFGDEAAVAKLDGAEHQVPARGWLYQWQRTRQ